MTTLSRGIRIGVASTDQNPILIYIYSVPDGGHPASVRAVLMQIFNYFIGNAVSKCAFWLTQVPEV